MNKIPNEWKILKIENILSLEYGKGLTSKHRKGNKYPVYGSNGIIGHNSEYLIKGPGIVVGRKGTIGSVILANINYWPIDTTYYIKLKGTEIDLGWLSNKLLTLGLSKLNMATGTPGLNRDLVYGLNVSIPSLQEQKKIAEILSAVDHSIEKTDESITKTERLKKGLMHELFTKGIGHKEFKETEIGKIPREWKAIKIENLLSLEYGSGLTDRERKGSEYPVYGSNGIIGYNSEYLVDGPGIIVGRKGTIGSIKWSEVNFWPIDTTYYVKLKELKINLRWLSYKLYTLRLSKLNMATGTPGLNRDSVYKLKISVPLFQEQQKIAEILSSIDERIQMLKEKKNKLERVKKGLMNELLTGRIRVKVEA
ncbi:MAG: restriction endonuclease subunit S [Candidatus Humimicrobiaceae bacterium]